MRLGPVFQAELITLARRNRFYIGRTLYGLLVLFIVGTTYQAMAIGFASQGGIPIDQLAMFGAAIFTSFAQLQATILLLMTPALVAGSIAEEKQRKTLHYLMASQLSSTEIVLGKAGARLLRAGVIGAIGLPILSLLSLFGGIDYQVVLLVYGATATTTFFLAALSICCSLHANQPRDAISSAYLLELLWLSVPTILLATMPGWNPFWRAIGEFCQPVLVWVALCSPTDLLRILAQIGPASSLLIEQVCWMMGSQILYGCLLMLYAAVRLRPVYRGEGAPGWLRRRLGPKQARTQFRLWPRPPCGADAMLWKEMHLHRIGTLKRVCLILLSLVSVGLTLYASWDTILGAVIEAMEHGWSAIGLNQRAVNGILRAVNGVVMVVLLLGLGSVAASSVSSEREGDTWTNLASSPLEGGDVIRAKILGAIWMFRGPMLLLGACWAFGLLVGALNPLGIIVCLVQLGIFSWFAAALGVGISLRSKNTIHALTQTIGILIFLNVGILILSTLLAAFVWRGEFELGLIGCMPFHFVVCLMGMDELRNGSAGGAEKIVAVIIGGTILYAIASIVLTYRAIERYDAVVDRPDRSRSPLTAAQRALVRKVTTASEL